MRWGAVPAAAVLAAAAVLLLPWAKCVRVAPTVEVESVVQALRAKIQPGASSSAVCSALREIGAETACVVDGAGRMSGLLRDRATAGRSVSIEIFFDGERKMIDLRCREMFTGP